MSYRPDIQILRAVAVTLVLLFHLSIKGFSSGFLGVDIFFVISGYLMQTLYGVGVGASDFYLRRARRLLPAYYGAVIAILIASAIVTLPSEFGDVVKQSLFASGLSSNIGFWLQVSYFETSEFRPYLHLWSLGVEAQFYLLFPLLVRLNRRWLATVLLISLAACLAAVSVSPKLAFFMVPFRIWEFAIGMLAARLSVKQRPGIGLAALILTVLMVAIPVNGAARNIFTGHPALPALAITLLTATTLLFRLPRVIEWSWPGIVAQKIGDVSYSLYLAHFPVIVLLNYQPFGGTRLGLRPLTIPLIVLATLVLYLGFERRGPRLFSVRRSLGAVMAVFLLAALLPRAQTFRFDTRDQLVFAALQDRSAYRCGKLFRILHPAEAFCPLGDGKPIMLVGDSHADAIKISFARIAQKHGWGAYLPVDNEPLRTTSLSPGWLKRAADARGVRFVFLHYAQRNFTPQLVEQARRVLGGRLVVIGATPEFSDSVPKALFEGQRPNTVWRNAALQAYLSAHPEIPVIQVGPALCAPGCSLADGAGRPLYFDNGHLTLTGARRLEPAFDGFFDRLDQPH